MVQTGHTSFSLKEREGVPLLKHLTAAFYKFVPDFFSPSFSSDFQYICKAMQQSLKEKPLQLG